LPRLQHLSAEVTRFQDALVQSRPGRLTRKSSLPSLPEIPSPASLAGASPPDLFTGSDRQAGGHRARRWAPPSPPSTRERGPGISLPIDRVVGRVRSVNGCFRRRVTERIMRRDESAVPGDGP
jgi:hypothetical protein